MIKLVVAVGAAIGACLVLLLLIFYAAGKKKAAGESADASHKTRPGAGERTLGPDSVTQVAHATSAVEEIGEAVPEVTCRGITLASPERSVTDTDAVVVDLIRQAPELPSAVLELSDLLRDPEAQMQAVAQLISTDPVLSAKVLRVANSAAYGLKKITSLQQAIVLLGFNNIWILVHQLMTSNVLQPFARLPEEEMARLWLHGASVAVCAKRILLSAGLATDEIGATVITCALMHDVGKFLLRGLQPVRKEMEDMSGPDGIIAPTVLDEEERYGINHCRMGYLLTTYWKLPEQVCTAIGYHHNVSFDNWQEIPRHVFKIVSLVALSDSVAAFAGYHDGRPVALKVLPEALKATGLDIDAEPSSHISGELMADLRRMETLLAAS